MLVGAARRAPRPARPGRDRGARAGHRVHCTLAVRALDGAVEREVVQPAGRAGREASRSACAAAAAEGGERAPQLLARAACGGRPRGSRPSSTSRSMLTRAGLPANADSALYGELPYPVGPTGNICHQLWPAAARKSTNARAARAQIAAVFGRRAGWWGAGAPRSRGRTASASVRRASGCVAMSLASLARITSGRPGCIIARYSSDMLRVVLGLLKGAVVGGAHWVGGSQAGSRWRRRRVRRPTP